MLRRTNVIRVGIADMNIVREPQLIRTSGLGSCVGVVIYDPMKKIAGMIHVMLPDSTLGKSAKVNIAKFADTGIPALVEQLEGEGARRFSLRAKIAGGAQMFQFGSEDTVRIGPRNVEAVKKQLRNFSIPIIAEDVGGSKGRTIEFDPVTTKLTIRTVNEGTKEI